MTMPDGNDLLMGSGYPAAKFPTPGTTVAGVVVGQPRSQQQLDYATKKPEFWDDGRPKMQVVVNLRTDLRDPSVPHDDGMRSLYIKGKNLTQAVRHAVRSSGCSKLDSGGRLEITYTGDGVATNGKPPKEYAATYRAPVNADMSKVLRDTQAQADPDVIPPCPPGMDEVKWRDLDPDSRARIMAAFAAR